MGRPGKILTEKEIDLLINDYLNNMDYKSICKKYGIGREKFIKILNEKNIHIRTIQDSNGFLVAKEQQESIINDYITKKQSIYSLTRKYHLSQDKIQNILKENGVKLRCYTEAKQEGRKYPVNDNYFKVQTSNMAYILGLIAADGNVAKKENCIAIQLLEEDEEILLKINNIISSTRPIKRYINNAGSKTSKLTVFSKQWKDDLKLYGIEPNKTFSLKKPSFLQNNFYIDYIKGYFDGDGCVSVSKDNKRITVSFSGASYEIINWMREVLINQYGLMVSQINTYKTSQNNTMYRFSIGSKLSVYKIYNLFYNNKDNLFLNRKYQIFYNFFHETSLPMNG